MKKLLIPALTLLTSCLPISKENAQITEQTKKPVSINDTLHITYFDIKVLSVEIAPGLSIPSQDIEYMAGKENKLVIIHAVFKNTDTETRSAEEGILYAIQNGKEYKFEKTEEIGAPGWGLFFDPINPLMEQTTNIVYKVPRDLNAELQWQPGRAEEDERITFKDVAGSR